MQQKHLVFYISLLKLALDNVSVLEQDSDNYLIKQEN